MTHKVKITGTIGELEINEVFQFAHTTPSDVIETIRKAVNDRAAVFLVDIYGKILHFTPGQSFLNIQVIRESL